MKEYRWLFAVHRRGRLVTTVEVVLSYQVRHQALAHVTDTYRRWRPDDDRDEQKLTALERHTWTPGVDPTLVA